MGWLYVGLNLIYSVVRWAVGFGQREIGRKEQQNEDKAKTIEKLDAELDAAVQHHDAVDGLRKHKF